MAGEGGERFWAHGPAARESADSETTRQRLAELERLWRGEEDPEKRQRLRQWVDALRSTLLGGALDERLY